jgi:hypothetical protein
LFKALDDLRFDAASYFFEDVDCASPSISRPVVLEVQACPDSEQQKPQPREEAAEVVAGGGEHGVDGVAACVGEVIAAYAVMFLEMADDGLNAGTPFELALDLRRDAALLAARRP